MRLLSIFALLFLISLMLHSGAGKRTPLGTSAAQEAQRGPEPAGQGEAQAPPEAQEDFSALIFKPLYPMGHFEFENEYNFSILEIELKNLIVGRIDDSFKSENHFCAVGYVLPRSSRDRKKAAQRKEVVVYWREGKILYRWTGGDPKAAKEDFYFARSLLFSPGISLDDSLTGENSPPPEESLADFRKNIENTLADCERHGKQYTIAPFAPPPRGFNVPRPPARPGGRITPDPDGGNVPPAPAPVRQDRPPRRPASPSPAPVTPYPGPIYTPEPSPPESPSPAAPSPEPSPSPEPPPSDPEPSLGFFPNVEYDSHDGLNAAMSFRVCYC
ncbi:MAG: hypothetical protein LBK55_12225 [Azoarcus sp.]|jgi:hypothetical protein|nr:hypothetical protein [Azoarcus sp.]